MAVTYIDAEGLPEPVGYRHAARSTGTQLVHIAGQVGVEADGTIHGEPGDVAAQAAQALRNAVLAFAAAGVMPQDIVRLNYYVVGLDEDRGAQVQRGLGRAVRELGMPAVPGTMVGITGLLLKDLLIEIDGIAAVG